MSDRLDLPQGTLDLLILRALSLEPKHGRAIGERIDRTSILEAARCRGRARARQRLTAE